MATTQAHKEAKRKIQQAHIVYDLPYKEEAIKWMHAVCGYPVKSTWIKAIKAGSYVICPMLTERNVSRYYPETNKTPKGHMNQSRKMSGPQSLNEIPSRLPNSNTTRIQGT